MDYRKLLEHSYELLCAMDGKVSRLEFLSVGVFDFTTYDSSIDELFARKSVEVCEVINSETTFEYQKDPENYKWYLIMCNMPFFAGKLEWGTSIRGAWWDVYGDRTFNLSSCFLYVDGDQILNLNFDAAQWGDFIRAVVEFSQVQCGEGG